MVRMLPRWYRRHKSLLARTPASQRFYRPTKCCPAMPTIGDLDDAWPRREDEDVRNVRLHGSMTHTRTKKQTEERIAR